MHPCHDFYMCPRLGIQKLAQVVLSEVAAISCYASTWEAPLPPFAPLTARNVSANLLDELDQDVASSSTAVMATTHFEALGPKWKRG